MTTPTAEATFLIVVADQLIAEDLRQTILERTPDARIIRASTHDEAMAAIAPEMQVVAAIIATNSQCFADSDLAVHLAQGRTRIMLAEQWDATLAQERGWSILPFPFTSKDVHALLAVAIPSI